MINGITIEVCCGGIDDALTAIGNHADRIELNSALELGGLTPSLSVLEAIRRHSAIPVCTMIRPRGFGFCYSAAEYEVMKQDAEKMLAAGADGIVFGFLNKDGTVDEERTAEMTALAHARNKEAVFHKAFDSARDMDEALAVLLKCGVDRVLTSGGAAYPDLEAGCRRIRRYQEQYGSRIQLLPGGGVRAHNVQTILAQTGCRQIHMTAKENRPDESIAHGLHHPAESELAYTAVSDANLKAIMAQIALMK
jgi:copper homeostasis protein